ncbi:MAG: hypothetical protein ACE37F_26330 [Nannocystaceae bacterium]|nr:hypothetical protein [bacterium]
MRRWALCVALLVGACGEDPSLPGMGLGLAVRVADASLQRGGLLPPGGGPAVTQVSTPQLVVRRGEGTVQLGGRLGAQGVSLLVHAAGDPHHWQVAPDGFDFVIADELLFGAELEFAHSIASEQVDVELQAVDGEGRAGQVVVRTFEVSSDIPPSQLLVSLAWDAPVDLDLHVELPSGVVVGPKNTNANEPIPGMITPPDGAMLGGYHDYDSNQHCGLDLRNRENVIWEITPPRGTYRVYAELFSACDVEAVNLEVGVVQGEDSIAGAGATMYRFDARKHARDGDPPGLLVLEFEVE